MQTLFQRLLNISAKNHQNRSLQFWAIPFQSWCILFETQCSDVLSVVCYWDVCHMWCEWEWLSSVTVVNYSTVHCPLQTNTSHLKLVVKVQSCWNAVFQIFIAILVCD